MKMFFQHILTTGIAVGAIVLTIDSALGKSSVYEKIEYEPSEAPMLSVSLRSMMDGETPYLAKLLTGDSHVDNGEAPEQEAVDTVAADSNSGENEKDTIAEGNAQSGKSESDADSNEGFGNEAVAEDFAETEKLKPVEEKLVMTTVSDDYFKDALFIGDSRTVGLSEYCPELMDTAEFYAKISLTIYNFDDKEFVEVPIVMEGAVTENGTGENVSEGSDGGESPAENSISGAENAEGADAEENTAEENTADASATEEMDAEDTAAEDVPTEKVTIEEALTRKQFGKIYIMLGLNELGSGTPDTYRETYGGVIDRIRELQPDALIYIQGIMHVTAQKSDNDKVFKNSTIDERNAALSTLADGRHVFYLDMNEATDDENGNLQQELSFDNVHLKAKSYVLWYDYLKTHAYVKVSDGGEVE